MSHRAVTALVVAHTPQGDVYTYRGGVVPDSVPADEIKRLVAEGFIEEVVPDQDVEVALVETESPSPSGAIDLEVLNLDELRQHAAAHNVDLAGATRKADIIAAIQAAKN